MQFVIDNIIDKLTDEQLASCVDEYVQRVINRTLERGFTGEVSVMVYASKPSYNNEYKIGHTLTLGNPYGDCTKQETSNCLIAVDQLVPTLASATIPEANSVTLAIAAPELVVETGSTHSFTQDDEPF